MRNLFLCIPPNGLFINRGQLNQKFDNLIKTFDKSPIIVYQPQKCPQLTNMNQFGNLGNCIHHGLFDSQSLIGEFCALITSFGIRKAYIFLGIQFQPMYLQVFTHILQVITMIFNHGTIDNDVINVTQVEKSKAYMNLIHHLLKFYKCIFQPKR